MYWYDDYIMKPWVDFPEPPHSFTCGELVRYVHKERLGIDIPPIQADGKNLKECIVQLQQPEAYGFYPFEGPPRPFDIVYLMRRVRRDHVALAVKRGPILMFLHCIQGSGVVLETETEMRGTTGSSFMEWRRHQAVSEDLALCRA